jgi:hypothetical protein
MNIESLTSSYSASSSFMAKLTEQRTQLFFVVAIPLGIVLAARIFFSRKSMKILGEDYERSSKALTENNWALIGVVRQPFQWIASIFGASK